MNPDQNRSGWTVNALLQTGTIVSIVISVFAIALLGFASFQLDRNTLILGILGCSIIVILGVLIVNYLVQRKIKDRILELVDVCRDYAGGDRTIRAAVNGDDGFAMLATSLNMLLDNQGGTPSGAVSLGSGGSDAAALQAQIEKLLQEVSAVGDGDLRVQAEVTPDTLGVLADSFNYMIEELAKVVGRVQSTAVQVTNATRRILDRSAELAQASETQVGQIAQTTEAVEALAVFIQNVARNAQLSAEVAQEALRNAASGQQAVRQSIDGMMLIRENVQETSKKIKRLGERSNEIGEIVRIIEDIADQTNLLALNAAIQSAMAGEHGRGFAVVADEIRLLAERSTESTKRIATLVKSIQGDTYEAVVAMEDSTQEVVKGSQLADEAGRSLNSIYSAVERQAQMIESIARAAHEQTSVSEAVAVAMSRISEITRQTDAGTQEAAVSVSYLAELAEQLRASVSTFRLPERTNEMLGSFSNMPSPAELPGANGNQMFPGQPAQVFSGQPAQVFSSQPGQAFSGQQGNEWDQGFAGNFPPLPEPGNTGSLVASLPSRNGSAGQYNFNNQNDFGGQQFSGQPNFGGQQFSGQPNFGGQQPFGGIPSGPGASQNYNSAQFGGQDFGNMGNLEGQQGFGSGGWYGAGQQFGGAPGAGYGSQNPPFAAGPNSGLLSLPAQGQFNPNQRWSGSLDQNQSPFGNDQIPFRDNG